MRRVRHIIDGRRSRLRLEVERSVVDPIDEIEQGEESGEQLLTNVIDEFTGPSSLELGLFVTYSKQYVGKNGLERGKPCRRANPINRYQRR